MGRSRKGLFGRHRSLSQRINLSRYIDWWNETDSDDYASDSELELTQGISQLAQKNNDGIRQSDLDDEICYGTLRGNVVGIQYYKGMVNKNEMVALEREPQNKYDINAIKVKNVAGQQVGHIKRELARPLAFILDREIARLEGIVPFGQTNVYSMPIDITLWGKPGDNEKAAVEKLKYHGFYLSLETQKSNKSGATSFKETASLTAGRSVWLSPAEVKNELDNLFDQMEEGDKTTLAEPAVAISSKMYPHQKQALNWMMMRENTSALPPFWEKKETPDKKVKYYSTIFNSFVDERPHSVKGGILADDMGLGKTLEMISLIVTNFVNNQPLAVPVTGLIRQNKQDKIAMEKFKALPTCESLKMANRRKTAPIKLKLEPNTSFQAKSGIYPELPKLPDDNYTNTPEESDNDDDCVIILDDNIMTSKEDPNFSPIMKQKKQAPKVSSPLITRRPKRNAKRPAKYAYSSDEDSTTSCEAPMKKAKLNTVSDKGKAPINGSIRKKGKIKATPIDLAGSAQEEQTKSETIEIRIPDLQNKENLPDLPDNVQSTTTGIIDDLPDLESVLVESGKVFEIDKNCSLVTPDYSKPSKGDTGVLTGRTPTTGSRCTLIVCPMSVLSNWLDQFETHVHRNVHLNIYLYYGSQRTKKAVDLERQDVVITTYSTVAADFKKGAKNPLKKIKWLRIVLDEGHAIKNPNAQQTKAICELQADRKWVLTGTPIQNCMKDLWSLINFLRVYPFTERQWWRRTIERPLNSGDQAALKRLQCLMSNISMRRTKTQLVNGKPLVTLPERNVYIEYVKFTQEERAVYEAMQKDGKLIVSKYFKQGTLLHNYGDILAILMRLRQLCCHPFLVAKAAQAVKDTMVDLEKNGGAVNDKLREKLIQTLMMVLSSGTDEECAICLESLNSPIITSCAHVYCRRCIEAVIQSEKPQSRCPMCRRDIDVDKLLEVPPEGENQEGNNSSVDQCTGDTWKPSAKIDALMTGLLKARSEDSRTKSIIVSQFTSLLTLLEIPLSANGFTFVRLDGKMNTKARVQAIDEFSSHSPDSPTIILLSLKAGGVGINLTAATRVFLIDPAWNPASEEQCFDRCHRLGQTKDVIITKYIVEDSVEERMMELQEKKRKLMTGAFSKKQSAEQKRQARIEDIKILFSF